jgi:hypothetical protein
VQAEHGRDDRRFKIMAKQPVRSSRLLAGDVYGIFGGQLLSNFFFFSSQPLGDSDVSSLNRLPYSIFGGDQDLCVVRRLRPGQQHGRPVFSLVFGWSATL